MRLDDIRGRIGQKVGVSAWIRMDQPRFDLFARATDDPDPLHVDPEWCRQHSPFGSTVAFGFLTLSMLTELQRQAWGRERTQEAARGEYGLNYGMENMRLIAPVPVGSRIRGHFTLLSVTERKAGEFLIRTQVEVEIEGGSRPALVGVWLSLLVTEDGHRRIMEEAALRA